MKTMKMLHILQTTRTPNTIHSPVEYTYQSVSVYLSKFAAIIYNPTTIELTVAQRSHNGIKHFSQFSNMRFIFVCVRAIHHQRSLIVCPLGIKIQISCPNPRKNYRYVFVSL